MVMCSLANDGSAPILFAGSVQAKVFMMRGILVWEYLVLAAFILYLA